MPAPVLRFLGHKPTLGLLVDRFEPAYQQRVITGVADAARDHGAHLLCFVGGDLLPPGANGAGRNDVFELASLATVDGLVLLSGALASRIGGEALGQFLDRVGDLPSSSIALEVGKAAAVLIDNDVGMRSIVQHLLKAHGYSRFAFVRGPRNNLEAERRFAVFSSALGEAGVALDQELVLDGDFTFDGGALAVAELFDGRAVDRSRVSAFVAANDAMALGVLHELSRRGFKLPQDFAVSGFDDVEDARFAAPSLTTVRQPLYEQGRESVRLVMAQLAGTKSQASMVLKTELVTRRSCRCFTEQAAAPDVSSVRRGLGFEALLVERRELIHADLVRATRGQLSALGVDWEKRLLNAFVSGVRGDARQAFGTTCDDMLLRVAQAGADLEIWSGAISTLRRHAVSCLLAEPVRLVAAENLLHEARLLLNGAVERVQSGERVRLAERTSRLATACVELVASFDPTKLQGAAARSLPGLGVNAAYVVACDGASGLRGAGRAVVAYDGPGSASPLMAAGQVAPCSEFVRALASGRVPRSWFVSALYVEGNVLGFCALELGAHGLIYEALREYLAVALAGSARSAMR